MDLTALYQASILLLLLGSAIGNEDLEPTVRELSGLIADGNTTQSREGWLKLTRGSNVGSNDVTSETEHLISVLNHIHEQYGCTSSVFENTLKFLEMEELSISDQGQGLLTIFNCMVKTGNVYSNTSDIFVLGYFLKTQITKATITNEARGDTAPGLTALEHHHELKGMLPGCVQKLIFADTIRFYNTYYQGYLYATSSTYNGDRRHVRHSGGNADFQTYAFEGGRYWRLRNTGYNEYLFFSGNTWDRDRGYIFTWTPGDAVTNGYFRFVARTSEEVNIFTKCQPSTGCEVPDNYPLYAADDKHDKNVFYWTPGNEINSMQWHLY